MYKTLKFQQSAWMKPYIEKNTALRAEAKSDFEKDFYKFKNIAVFGKTVENVRNRIRVDLVKPEEEENRLRRLIADPAFKTRKIFDVNLVAIHSAKSTITLNKPDYVGLAILDLSKLWMDDFWYKLKVQYGEKIQLCYTDTDSLLFQVETDDFYADMRARSELYDFSDYLKGHPCYSIENKKVVGKFKDECNGKPIAEFVGLRSKMYSILKAPTFLSYKIFDESLMAIHWANNEVKLIHPVYDPFEYWKFKFWCTQIKHKYGEKVQLCDMGTYSILSPVETEDFYADMRAIAEHYDFSDYSIEYKKIVDSGTPIANSEEIRKAKGVQRVVINSQGILQKSGNKFLATRFFHQVVEKGS